jgi:chemosensory pili system protein ChpA (sensor histidine kinase/response regulator)
VVELNRVIPESLLIVGDELAVTLRDARMALEQFAEGEGGPNILDRCVRLLHTAGGVLRMTETYGASLLAEEMEQTCRHLGSLRGKDGSEEAIDALSRAAVQLPAYVERILNGGRDIPLVLLPLLNDLRAARAKPLLSESTLLLLNVFTPGKDDDKRVPELQPSGEDIQALSGKLRPRFQLALLGWIRGSEVERHLATLGDIAGRLESAATETEVHRLWWVVTAITESLADRVLESSVSLKRLMGQVDREMKRLISVGEERCAAQPPRELVNNLLYYIARVSDPGPRVMAIREAFQLSDLVPADSQVEAVRESLSAPSARLMETVAEAIREDLGRVKDVLDIYVRTGMEHVEELLPQVELLKKIGDTLGVLGLGELREIVQQRRDELERITGGAAEGQETSLVEMAASLLEVERSLGERLFGLIAPDEMKPEAESGDDEDVDYVEVSRAVMRECVVNLARIKDAVSQVVERPGDSGMLDSVPAQLRGITAGLLILNKTEAVAVVEGIGSAIGEIVQQGYAAEDSHRLDLLADAMVSLDYYLETLEAGRREPVYMLENAERCLAALREAAAMPAVRETAQSGMATTMALEESSATVEALDSRALALVPGAGGGDHAERADPEIIELFIEEAGEEIESIQAMFPIWRDDPGREDELTSLRRSFHTLKGSGRMVGAMLIGDFAWSFENLLNRVINKTLDADAALVGLVAEAVDALPELLEQLEVGTPPPTDVASLIARASAMAEGREAVPTAETSEPAPEPGTGTMQLETVDMEAEGIDLMLPDDGAAAEAEPAIDPVLLEILSKEVGGHLDTIDAFLAESSEGTPPFAVPEELYRACHTLHGSVTMAKAEVAAELTAPLNRLVRHAYDHDVPVDEKVLSTVDDTVRALRELVDAYPSPGAEAPDSAELVARLSALDEAIEAQAATRAEVEAEADTEFEAESELETQAEPEIEAEPIPEIESPTAAAGESLPDFDPEIAGIFAEEAAEILESCDAALAQLSAGAAEAPLLEELQRHLHTLKGGARMAGLASMGDLSHDLEALVIAVNSERLTLSPGNGALLQSVVDSLHGMRDQVAAGRAPARPDALFEQLAAALAGEEALPVEPSMEAPSETPAEAEPTAEPAGDVAPEVAPETPAEAEAEELEGELPAVEPIAAEPEESLPPMPLLDQIGKLARDLEAPAQPEPPAEIVAPAAGGEPVLAERRQLARVDPEMLEQLLNNAGEISIFHSRLSQQMSQIQFNLEELGQTVVRLRDQLRSLELATEAQILYRHQADMAENEKFDPLELDRYSKIQQLSRALAETASDVNSLKDLLQTLTGDTEALLVQQSRTATELQDGLMRTRMVPFQGHATRLARLVRQAAAEHDKQAELTLRGGGELDRQVLEKMLPPFEHMLRNAVIHGIELPAEREAAGKSPTGTVSISLRREGAEVLIVVEDDGSGLNIGQIRQKAIEKDLLDTDSELTDEEVMQFILRPGFSTAERLTQSAGRGIGMDVVASEISKLGGTLRIESTAGEGTRFTVRLPFTLAVTQALIVRTGTEIYALPLPTVEGIIRISREDFASYMAREDASIEYGGQRYAFRHLGQYLGTGPSRIDEDEERISIILVRAGESSTALVTDEMLDSREIVVKPVGDQLASIRGISGATILGDGRVVVILDAGALVRSHKPVDEPVVPAVEPAPDRPTALVVDDSITMRRVTQRLLDRNDFRVFTAKDGVEAVGVLQEHIPDIILLDVEMPRMDGYEFAAHVRNNPDSEGVPIIMITSRVSDKHRARAIELGVNDYLGKPYQEQELMDAVNHLLKVTVE